MGVIMRKPELAEAIAEKTELSVSRANEVISIILDEIVIGLSRKQTVVLPAFGTFEHRERRARKGINPKTKEAIDIAASVTVGFKPAKALKESVNT